MKKFLILSIVALSFFFASLYFYSKSESQFSQTHQSILRLFYVSKNTEAELEDSMFESITLLAPTYDELVSNENEAEKICVEFKSPKYGLYLSKDGDLEKMIDVYCEELSKKIASVEIFKSKHAVLKNSYYFIQNAALEERKMSRSVRSKNDIFAEDLISASMAYTLISGSNAEGDLEKVLNEASTYEGTSPKLKAIIRHSQKILESKGIVDKLIREVAHAPTEGHLEEIRNTYLRYYEKADSTATFYRQLLFISSCLFFILIISNIYALWKAGQQLEIRVKERTKDLEDSSKIIVQQQQALITSAKLSSLGEMAGGVAHEINNPLAVISMRIEQLEESVNEGSYTVEEIKKTIQVVKRTADRIGKIVNGLRFFAREGRNTRTEPSLLGNIISETMSLCQERFISHGVNVEIKNTTSDDLQIDCRGVEVSQVLLNLLNNAFDAIQPLPEKWIRLEINDRDKMVEIIVTDSGHGIPVDLQDRIMEPFFTTKEIGKGTGLGLSISKGIIESHHGKLMIDNHSPHTCFMIILPKSKSSKDTQGVAA